MTLYIKYECELFVSKSMIFRFVKVFLILLAIISLSEINSSALDHAVFSGAENSYTDQGEFTDNEDSDSGDANIPENFWYVDFQQSKTHFKSTYLSPFVFRAFLASIFTRAPPYSI